MFLVHVVDVSVWVSVHVHCGRPSSLGCSLTFGCSSLFVGSCLHCMGGHGLSLVLHILPLAIVMWPLWCFSVQSSVGGLGWIS